MVAIFWDKYGILLTEYLPGETAISSPHYASILEGLCYGVVEKCGGKVSDRALLLHDSGPVYKCNIVQTVIRKAGFIELNHPIYSSDIAPSAYYLFSNLKKFPRGRNFSRNNETISTVEDYLNNLDSEFFCKGMESLRDHWHRVIANEDQYRVVNNIIQGW